MVAIVSVAEMRALERAAIDLGTPEAALQENAGSALAREVLKHLQDSAAVAVVVVGHGNNGRDGAVAARHLARMGRHVTVLLGPHHAVTDGEVDTLRALGCQLHPLEASTLGQHLRPGDVAVDALVGIGAHGALREPAASAVRALAQVRRSVGAAITVVAVDLPSGVDADTGAVKGPAVQADYTLTFGAVKAGLLRFPAADYVGELSVAPIGLRASDPDQHPIDVIDWASLRDLIPRRPAQAHKYDLGRVLAVVGSDQYPGAAILSASAAARAGAGLVTVFASDSMRQVLSMRLPEATYVPVAATIEENPLGAVDALEESLRQANTLLMGPGLGRSAGTLEFMRGLLERRARVAAPSATAVLDADTLSCLSQWPEWWKAVGTNIVLTPHGGELARLAGATAPDDQAVWEWAIALSQEWGHVLVAKGPFTAVASPDGRASVWPRANAALATAGTGDVLAGLCAGLLAQGLLPAEAGRLAVGVHAEAARSVQAQHGWRTLLASDLLTEIPGRLAAISAGT